MLSAFCPARFGVLFCSVVLGCRYARETTGPSVSGARFLTVGVFECGIIYRRSVAVLCMLYQIRCNPMHPLKIIQCGLHAVPWSHICILMRRLTAEARSTALLLLSSQCPSGTILLTPNSMVWDWRV